MRIRHDDVHGWDAAVKAARTRPPRTALQLLVANIVEVAMWHALMTGRLL